MPKSFAEIRAERTQTQPAWTPRPGNVCLVRYADSETWVPGICTTPHGNWRTQEHGSVTDGVIAEARPLVVVDLEDPDLPLAHEIYEALDTCGTRDFRVQRERIRNALRALIGPPRCNASLNIKGEAFICDGEDDHPSAVHHNEAAGAIWGPA